MNTEEITEEVFANRHKWHLACMWDHYDLWEDWGLFIDHDSANKQDQIWEYELISWQCSMEPVGVSVLIMDNKICAITFKPYRKSRKKYYWLTEVRYEALRAYVSTFHRNDDKITLFDDDIGADIFKQATGLKMDANLYGY